MPLRVDLLVGAQSHDVWLPVTDDRYGDSPVQRRREPDDWVQIGQTMDDTFADGQPGLGFFVREEIGNLSGVGLRDYSVEEI